MSAEPLSERQRWATASGRPLGEIASIPTPLLRRGQPIAIVGGALAAALVQPIRDAGFEIVAAEARHPLLDGIPDEAAEYEAFGNGYGEIHSARAFRQLVERAARTFTPREDRWYEDGRVVDPFRPNLRYAAASDHEFDVLTERHLNTVRSAFRRARVVLVALSSSEVWEAVADGATYPHWADGAQQRFDAGTHRLRMLTMEESVADLEAAAAALRELNPGIEIILMVSPELQPATALPIHVLAAATLGKAVLRIAAESAARLDGVHYFPALEIASLSTPLNAFDPQGVVPPAFVGSVAEALIQISEGGGVGYDQASSAITVFGGDAPVAPKKSAPGKAPPRQPGGVQAAADDAYTKAVAAEKAEKDRVRATKRAKRGAGTDVTDAPLSKHDQKVAEREARQKAKAAERAAKVEASTADDAAALARAQKRTELKARAEARIAAREANRAAKSAPPAQAAPETDAAAAAPRVRRARTRKTTAASPEPMADPATAVIVEPAPTRARKEGRSRRVKPTAATPPSEAANDAPTRVRRERKRKPKT